MKLTTKEAFGQVINQRGIHHQLGMSSSAVRNLRKNFNDGQKVSLDKMHEVLMAYGLQIHKPTTWKM